MKRLLTVLLTLLAAPAAAECTGASLLDTMPSEVRDRIDADAQGVPFAEGLLWQAAAPDGTLLTLMGTLHAYDARQDAQMAALAPLLDQAALLVVEISDKDQVALQDRIARTPGFAVLNEPPSLLTMLGPDDWAVLAERMAERGVPPFLAAQFRPWYAGMVLSVPPCMMRDMIFGRKGLDLQLIDEALRRGLPVNGLDDAQAMLDMFSAGTPEQQLQLLRMALLPQFSGDEGIVTTVDLYFQGLTYKSWRFGRFMDLGLSAEQQATLDAAFEIFEEQLLTRRNRDWIDRLIPMTAGQNAVVAVGAAHLPGKDGLLNLLQARGFEIRRLD